VNSRVWIGIDVGSITCKVVVIDEKERILGCTYRRTRGRIVEAVKEGLREVRDTFDGKAIGGCVTTGSARRFVGALVDADGIKNEITAHTRGALHLYPDARTVIELGGEDSKIILLRDGVPVDFAMNTVCAAGTGAFLDQLARRLDVPVEHLGSLAARSTQRVAIAGRCTVFAESDIIFKQQTGHRIEDIIAGACRALVRNYLNDVGKGKVIDSPILFLGGVAANEGIRQAFSEALDASIIVPEHHHVMGAFGAAVMARETERPVSSMRGIESLEAADFRADSFLCPHCANACEIVRLTDGGQTVACLGGRCERWAAEATDPSDALLSMSMT